MKRTITSEDVAKEAGVSRATVSYVLNNVKGVKIKPETRKRVLEAARKLNYYPNSIARALKTDRSMSVGVVSRRDIADDRFSKVLRGIKDSLKTNKYSITLCRYEKDINGNREYINYFLAKKIDGVILLSAEEELSQDIIQNLISYQVPTVLADYHDSNKDINSININYYHGGYTATHYLIEQGYENILYFAPAIDIPQERERLKGVKTAIAESDNKINKFKELIIGKDGAEYINSINTMLEESRGYTAVIVSWINVAYKVLSEAIKININIPEDLAVISLAGTHYAELSYPRLTTCDLPLYDLGYRSGEVLIDTINNAESKTVEESLPCKLIRRKST